MGSKLVKENSHMILRQVSFKQGIAHDWRLRWRSDPALVVENFPARRRVSQWRCLVTSDDNYLAPSPGATSEVPAL